jgi:5-methylcytosine-specific restriction endonuclease McrA
MTATIRKSVFFRTSGHCHFCGDRLFFSRRGMKKGQPEKGAWEVDHVIQKNKGGKNSTENYLPACVRCNRLRWHHKGRALRELLLLGLIAKGEIKKGTDIGRHLRRLALKHIAANKQRQLKEEPMA